MLKASTESLSESLSIPPLLSDPLHKPARGAGGLGGSAPVTELHNRPSGACKSLCSWSRELFPPLLLNEDYLLSAGQILRSPGKPQGIKRHGKSRQVPFKHMTPEPHRVKGTCCGEQISYDLVVKKARYSLSPASHRTKDVRFSW